MNGNECVGAESLFEPAFDIDGQLMGAEHAHPRIDADMGFDGDGGSDTACAQMVRFGHLLRVGQDVQYLLLGCGGKGVFEQFSEAASQQVERDLEDKDRNDEGCQRIGDAPLVAQKIGEPDTRQGADRRKCVAAVVPGVGYDARRLSV